MSEAASSVGGVTLSSPPSSAVAAERQGERGRATGLDESQRAVLDRADRSFAVIGAPGTGKTSTLVELVAERVSSGVPVERVLVLTPGRQSAARLRDRLAVRLDRVTTGPLARTPASLAFAVVRQEALARGADAPVLLTGAEHDALIAEVLDGHESGDVAGPEWPEGLPARVRATRQFRDELRELSMRATELGVPPSRLEAIGRDDGRPEWVAAARFLDELHRVADHVDARRIDSAQLIAEARRVISAAEDRGLDLIVADDLQDFDAGALLLLGSFARRGADVVAFGDPDVATKSFRGARGDSLGRLGDVLGARLGPPSYLRVVHRHGTAIRGAVAAITQRVGSAAAGRQRGAATAEPAAGSLEVRLAGSPSDEGDLISTAIRRRRLFDGVAYSQMAVIARSNAVAERLRRALERHGIPSAGASQGIALVHRETPRALLTVVAVAVGGRPADASLLDELLLSPLGGLDALALRRLRRALRHDELAAGGARGADELLLEALGSPGRLDSVGMPAARRAGRLAALLDGLRRAAGDGSSIEELLWSAWTSTGVADALAAQAAGGGPEARRADLELDAVVALFDAARRHVERNPEAPPYGFVVSALSAEVVQDTLGQRADVDSVTIATPSAVVGREFDTVVVAGVQEGTWPNLRLRGTLLAPHLLEEDGAQEPDSSRDARAGVLSDELRMLALAVSRAGRHCLVTAVDDDDQRPSPFLRLLHPDGGVPASSRAERPPLTLRALVGRLRSRLAEGDAQAAPALARLRDESVAGADPSRWYGTRPATGSDVLVDLTDDDAVVSVSPSHLERYERSPLAWFVDRVAGARPSTAMAAGTLLHTILERAGVRDSVDLADLVAALDERWDELRFEAGWQRARERRRVERKLGGIHEYLSAFALSGRSLTGSEQGFVLEVGQARVRGTVDRLEAGHDGVRVIDLKTGSAPPTRSQVAEHLQLGVYQLAVRDGVLGIAGSASVDGGSALLYVGTGTDSSSSRFRLLERRPLEEAEAGELRARILDAARGMASGRYHGELVRDEFDPLSAYEYRVQLVRAVSE